MTSTNDPYPQGCPPQSLSWSQPFLLAEAYHPDFAVPARHAHYRSWRVMICKASTVILADVKRIKWLTDLLALPVPHRLVYRPLDPASKSGILSLGAGGRSRYLETVSVPYLCDQVLAVISREGSQRLFSVKKKSEVVSYSVHLPHASVIERAWGNVCELATDQEFIHNPHALHEIKIRCDLKCNRSLTESVSS